jgi:G:T/U-mismatch repair DNA glycosylase
MSLLSDINLTETQQEELKTKLDSWKIAETKRIEAELTEKYEQLEASLREEDEHLVEEVKENLKKVYSKRFSKALKEMYEQIKAEVMIENLEAPEVKALESIKTTIYPFVNEASAKRHKDEFKKLSEMYIAVNEELELLKGENKKSKLMESLSPDVRKVVDKLIGEGTREQIVERFASIKQALKEEVSLPETNEERESEPARRPAKQPINEDFDDDFGSEIVVQRKAALHEEREEKVVASKTKENVEFEKQLNEQLILAGIKDIRPKR